RHPLSLYPIPNHPDPHSFPTRRSSDLNRPLAQLLAALEPPFPVAMGVLYCNPATSYEREVVVGTGGSLDALLNSERTTTSRSYRSEEHTSELQSRSDIVCRLLLEKKKS